MRILLQRRDGGLYFKDTDSWTTDGSEAMDFVSSSAALDFCTSNKLTNVQIVLKFDGERYDIVLPQVPPPAGESQRPTESV